MFLVELAEYVDSIGFGRIGEDLFIGYMPPEIKEGILLRTPTSGTPIDHYLKKLRKPIVQMIVRDTQYERGYNRAVDLSEKLDILEIGLTNYHIQYIRPAIDPIVYPRSDGGYLEFAVNFDCRYYRIN